MAFEAQPKKADEPSRPWGREDWMRVAELLLITAASISAVFTFRIGLAEQREQAAYEAWERYSEFSVEYPDLASGQYKYLGDGSEKDTRYENFVDRFLLAAEMVLNADPDDLAWRSTLIWEVRRHQSYISHSDFYETDTSDALAGYCTYDPALRDLLAHAIGTRSYRTALAGAEIVCDRMLTEKGEA
jgi:hypothetical protein